MFISSAIDKLNVAEQHANQGLEESLKRVNFFKDQIQKIITTRQALSAIEDINLDVPPPAISELSAEHPAPAKAKKAKEKKAPAADKKPDDDTPKTKAEFWLGLITTTPQKTGEILDAACKALGVTDKDQRAKLKQRQNFNLQNFIDAQKIRSEGEQQNRTYFL